MASISKFLQMSSIKYLNDETNIFKTSRAVIGFLLSSTMTSAVETHRTIRDILGGFIVMKLFPYYGIISEQKQQGGNETSFKQNLETS